MPNLKHPELFHLNASAAFDMDHPGGAPAPHDGIYRCFCGHEWPGAEGTPLPTGPHPLHPPAQPNGWRLVAAARHNVLGGLPLEPGAFKAPPGWPPEGG